MAKQKRVCLFLESNRIVKTVGRTKSLVTLDEARELWESGTVNDWNLSFERLARQFHFDLKALREYYAANERTTGPDPAPQPPLTPKKDSTQ